MAYRWSSQKHAQAASIARDRSQPITSLQAIRCLTLLWHGYAQVKTMGYWGMTSFLFSFFKWFFGGPASASNCGFNMFPSLGIDALNQTWQFDFSLTYVGVGEHRPYTLFDTVSSVHMFEGYSDLPDDFLGVEHCSRMSRICFIPMLILSGSVTALARALTCSECARRDDHPLCGQLLPSLWGHPQQRHHVAAPVEA